MKVESYVSLDRAKLSGGVECWHRRQGQSRVQIGVDDRLLHGRRVVGDGRGMLKLTAKIKCQWSRLSPARTAHDGVESLPVGPAEIVVNRLRKVVTIPQGHAPDLGAARVCRLQLGSEITGAFQVRQFDCKFLTQRLGDGSN